METIGDYIFQHIVHFLAPNWECGAKFGGQSRNNDLTCLISMQKHEKIRTRLTKCIELWWRKANFQILSRNLSRLLSGSPMYVSKILSDTRIRAFLHEEVSIKWEDRCWYLDEAHIHDFDGSMGEPIWCDGRQREASDSFHTINGGPWPRGENL